jgi:ribosomal protein S18 acetylase RimI-like enzyme
MSQLLGEVTFRPFRVHDLSECSRLAADAWPAMATLVPEEEGAKFMRSYVELSRSASTWLEVACIGKSVVGFLFGSIDADCNIVAELKAFISSLVVGVKVLTGSYGRLSRPLTLLRKYLATERKVERPSSASDAEVELFVVGSPHRGKGIGKALMDRFVAVAERKKARVITVYTDPLSNWMFYERYGFRRSNTFEDDFNSYLKHEDVKGFIYAIETRVI